MSTSEITRTSADERCPQFIGIQLCCDGKGSRRLQSVPYTVRVSDSFYPNE
jgi:hypothetical protein